MAMLACGLAGLAGGAAAQTAVCSNTPAAGERVECAEDSASTDDIDILLEGVDVDIVSTQATTPAVHARHEGSGDIDIDVTHGLDESDRVVRSTIDTSGEAFSYAIHGQHDGAGTVDIALSDTTINTTGLAGEAIRGLHNGTGQILVDLDDIEIHTTGRSGMAVRLLHYGAGRIRLDVDDTEITTTGRDGIGLYARHYNTSSEEGADANVSIEASSTGITTEGQSAHGIWSASEGPGDTTVTSNSNTITTKGRYASAIFGYHLGDGDIVITSTQDTISTENDLDGGFSSADGIRAWHQRGNGDAFIKVVGGSIRTAGSLSAGITGWHGSTRYDPVATRGLVDVEVEDTVIETAGSYGYGIWGVHTGNGGVRIVTKGNSRITTTGASAHGIVAYHSGTGEDRSIDITVGGTVDAQGAGADGVRVGRVSSGNAERAAAFDGDGYRKQTVRVNGRIAAATGAGILLAGGGRVFIGPTGSIEADSGIAILASGDTPGDNEGDPAIKPKLFIGMELDGRRVADVIGDGWILNDGGETSIAVNGTLLHDGATGAVKGAVAANGAWNVSIRNAGVRVTDRADPDPANWTVSEPATGVIADRDFSADDFTETCPAGQFGSPPNCRAPRAIFRPPEQDPPLFESVLFYLQSQGGTSPTPEFLEVYAPRAAVYEALPGFLLRLNALDSGGFRALSQEAVSWARLSGGRGAYEPERASVGAEFDLRRHSLEAGLDIPLGESTVGLVSIRSIRGSADVSAPTGGGKIDAGGYGAAAGLSVNGPNGLYARGGLSYTDYKLDFVSDTQGILKTDVDAGGWFLDFEAGQRNRLNGMANVSPRIRAAYSKIDADDFADTVSARVSISDASRFTGAVGVAVAAQAADRSTDGLALRGSIDLERTFGGATTRVLVSGEDLFSEAPRTRLLTAFGATYRRDGFSFGLTARAADPASENADYSAQATFRVHF